MRISKETEKSGLTIISDDEELFGVFNYWADLHSRIRGTDPFKSPLWLIPWRETFQGGELRTFAFYAEGQLEAFAPMYIHNFTHPYVRELTFLGTGNSDYTDALINDQHEEEFLSALFEEILSTDDWELLNLSGLRQDSALLRFARANLPSLEILEEDVCPVISLPPTIEEYNTLIGSRKLKKIRWAEKKLSELGNLKLEKADMYSIASALETLFNLHNKSQRIHGKEGVFNDYKMKSFLRMASMGLMDTRMLDVYCLKIDNKVVASLFILKRDKTMYYYIGGYEPEVATYSPGAICIYNVIKEAIKTGFKEFDFLKGNEPYKYGWGAKEKSVYNLKFQVKDL